jgi:hypothetical protein
MIKWVEGILYRDGYVLIGKLRKKNPLITRLQWTFPFRQLEEDESPRKAIKFFFKSEFGIEVVVSKFLLKYNPSEKPNLEQYFYGLKYSSGNAITSKNYSQFLWIKPTQVLKYFSTSISKELMDYLRFLEKTGKEIVIN